MDQTEWIDLHFLSYISLKSGLVGKDLQDRRLLLHLLVNKSIHPVARPLSILKSFYYDIFNLKIRKRKAKPSFISPPKNRYEVV